MHVAELCRYPVKSLQGERLESVPFTADGLEGDRRFAIFDSETGLGLTARRVPALLFGSARLLDGGALEITLPDGSIARDDGALADWLGTRAALRSSDEHIARRYENPLDFERESTSDWARFDGADRAFHDSPDVRVSLLSTATIGSWDRRRFRPNVLLDGDGEDELVGAKVALGSAILDIGVASRRVAGPAGTVSRARRAVRLPAGETTECGAADWVPAPEHRYRFGR
jgi:uncharacterized protein